MFKTYGPINLTEFRHNVAKIWFGVIKALVYQNI